MPNKDGAKCVQSHEVKSAGATAGQCGAVVSGHTTKHGAAGKVGANKSSCAVASTSKAADAHSSTSCVFIPAEPPPPDEAAASELLGSLTTTMQQRTSARVIKKLRLDSYGVSQEGMLVGMEVEKEKKEAVDFEKGEKDGVPNPLHSSPATASRTTQKNGDKETATNLKLTVKQRMPKALWSADEKTLFFEALNESGKDFDAITTHICAKMKKKGVTNSMMKTKHQVSHFYYRTWHKLLKHVHFCDNVKKVVQELYALINYGEMRKRLSSLTVKSLARLFELIERGSVAFRTKGKTLRIRTPMCRALRRLNQLEDAEEPPLRIPTRAQVRLHARDARAWARVQARAHNPRVLAPAAPRASLASLLRYMARRWDDDNAAVPDLNFHDRLTAPENCSKERDSGIEDCVDGGSSSKPAVSENTTKTRRRTNVNAQQSESRNIAKDIPLSNVLEPDRVIFYERTGKSDRREVLHVGPRTGAEIHLPTISLSEPLTSQKICFASYQERLGALEKKMAKESTAKLKNVKRTRKDSGTEKESDHKKIKCEENPDPKKLMDIDETATDGIELMASLKEDIQRLGSDIKLEICELKLVSDFDDKEKTESEELVNEEMEAEKECFSEDNETDNEMEFPVKFGKEKSAKFPNLKVKFRVRMRKDKKSEYSVITSTMEGNKGNFMPAATTPTDESGITLQTDNDVNHEANRLHIEADAVSKDIPCAEIDGISKLKPLKENDMSKTELDLTKKVPSEKVRVSNSDLPKKVAEHGKEVTAIKSNIGQSSVGRKMGWMTELVMRQVKKGWSIHDVGDITIGDLYLMFGADSKLELDYWWAEPSPPLPTAVLQQIRQHIADQQSLSINENAALNADNAAADKEDDDKEKGRESDGEIFSPKNNFGHDSNDGISGDEKKDLLASPEHKARRWEAKYGAPFRIASKFINNPSPGVTPAALLQALGREDNAPGAPPVVPHRDTLVTITSRLRKLLSLSRLHNKRGRVGCPCGHVCGSTRTQETAYGTLQEVQLISAPDLPFQNMVLHEARPEETLTPRFRTPIPIAPNPAYTDFQMHKLDKLTPSWTNRRGRPRNKQVVVRRTLPLMPKPPNFQTPTNLVPLRMMPTVNTETEPKLAPKPDNPRPTSQGKIINAKNTRFIRQNADNIYMDKGAMILKNMSTAQESRELTQSSDIFSNKSESFCVLSEPFSVKSEASSAKSGAFTVKSEVMGSKSDAQSPKSEAFSLKSEPLSSVLIKSDASLSNLLDISLPSNMGDESMGAGDSDAKTGGIQFTGLLHTESMLSISAMSPSRLLKDSDGQWLDSDVHDFSLSSFLNHLETQGTEIVAQAPETGSQGTDLRSRLTDPGAKKGLENNGASSIAGMQRLDANGSRRAGNSNITLNATEEVVDTQLQCMMSETSIDYMAKFADLAAEVTADTKQ